MFKLDKMNLAKLTISFKFSTTVKMNTLISTFHFRLRNSMANLSNNLKLSRRFATNETYYVENI